VNFKDSLVPERPPSPGEDSAQTAVRAAGRAEKNPVARLSGHDTRIERAEMQTEQAEIRTERAETRTELAELRTEQAGTVLQHSAKEEVPLPPEISTPFLKEIPLLTIADRKSPLEKLTSRQREILQLIAEGQNTEKIADILKVSPKTIEYHRMKLMACLDIHDVPGLMRLAMQAGLLPQENMG
jgi:DNA-binding NarL/FixJ family response regulator